jgi:hypothetical protein
LEAYDTPPLLFVRSDMVMLLSSLCVTYGRLT